jgi:anti-anti-sigma factor
MSTDLKTFDTEHEWRPVDRGLWIRRDAMRQTQSRQVVSLSGEIRLRSADGLADTLEDVVSAGADWLVLDMAGVDSLDPGALRALALVAQDLESRGGRLQVRRPRALTGRSLEMVGLGRLVMHDD